MPYTVCFLVIHAAYLSRLPNALSNIKLHNTLYQDHYDTVVLAREKKVQNFLFNITMLHACISPSYSGNHERDFLYCAAHGQPPSSISLCLIWKSYELTLFHTPLISTFFPRLVTPIAV